MAGDEGCLVNRVVRAWYRYVSLSNRHAVLNVVLCVIYCVNLVSSLEFQKVIFIKKEMEVYFGPD